MGRKLLYDEDNINNAAIAIQKKAGTKDTFTTADFADMIMKCGEPPSKDVDFYDYDGTRIASYTSEEFMELTEMPDLPDHTDIGLVNEGWNWSLETIQKMADPHLNVGCSYHTSDGATKIFYRITKSCTQQIRVYTSANSSGTLDWGDESEVVTIDDTMTVYEHTYTDVGEYVVSINAPDGTTVYIGGNNQTAFGLVANATDIYKDMITGIFMGKRVIFKYMSLRGLLNLKFIVIHDLYDVEEYSQDKAYAVGDLMYRDNRYWNQGYVNGKCYYRCKTAISAGTAFNWGHWEDVIENNPGATWANEEGHGNLKAIIIPFTYVLPGDSFMSRSYARVISTGEKNYYAYMQNGTFVGCMVDRFMYSGRTGYINGSVLDNQYFENLTVKRFDIMLNRCAEPGFVYPMGNYNNRGILLEDVYYQNVVALPYIDANTTPHVNAKIHVPHILYERMMQTNWATKYGDRLIEIPKADWEDDYDILVSPTDWIPNTRIQGWNGAEVEDSNLMSTDFISVNPGEMLYLTYTDYCNDGAMYNENKEYVTGDPARMNYRTWDCDNNGFQFPIPNNVYYMRLTHKNYAAPFVTIWRKRN